MGKLGSKRVLQAFVCGLVFGSHMFSQTIPDTLENDIEEVVESALENGTRDVEDSQFAEKLIQLSETPIDLNVSTASDLQQVPGIDAMLASRIVSFRTEHGFSSVDELLHVEGMDHTLFLQIRGFLVVKKQSISQDAAEGVSVRYTERTIRRLQDQRGFLDGTYSGNPYKIYNRIKGRYILNSEFSLEAGWLSEKDQGEKNIADFSSGFLSVSNTTKSLRCIVGDYVVEAGQGLALWRSTGTTKGSEVISTITKNPRGLQPYASSDENGFLRGAAIQARLGGVVVTGFMSRRAINANLNDQGSISSFDASGLFRTQSELQAKSSSSERVMGVNAEGRLFDGFRMGIRAYTTNFDHLVALSGINGFHGRNASVESIDFSYASSAFGTFAEVAVDRAKSTAVISGIVLEPISALDVALVFHYYPQRFVSLHGFGFGESGSKLQNEKGVYTSARLPLFSWLVVSAYYDQFATVGASTLSLLPTDGNEFLSVVCLQSGENSSFEFQVKQKSQADQEILFDSFSRSTTAVGRRIQANYRASFEWNPSTVVRWRTRMERVRVEYSLAGPAATGFLFYQDMRLRPKTRLSIDGRVVVFDTDSYDSRIYEYESELHGTFVNPALFGKGIRMYVLTRYETGIFEISVKYSTTLKPGMKSLGSGTNEIQGDTDNQLSLQIDVTI